MVPVYFPTEDWGNSEHLQALTSRKRIELSYATSHLLECESQNKHSAQNFHLVEKMSTEVGL